MTPAQARRHAPHRVHSSCDRCRSRKTKCIDPIPGPCRYCARTGSTCRIATPRRKRPYYHVTEEEYQCSMRILEHFFPNRELNLQSLRAIAKDIVNDNPNTPINSQTTQASPILEQASPNSEGQQDVEPAVESVNDLHEPLGCLMKDSQGRFRYIGAHSEIPFNAAVCSIGDDRKKPSSIIAPPKVGAYPPNLPTPTSMISSLASEEQVYLPPRAICDSYISSFLEYVHSTHWFYSIETFLAAVDRTFSSVGALTSSSWMCSLYSIFAIGASSSAGNKTSSSLGTEIHGPSDEKTSMDYIALAKGLVPFVYDEADIDSIRALAILSIALENQCSRVTSYLYMGAAIQMAYSLGLHRNQMPDSSTSLEREQYRRIWWTLFTLEQEVASRGGSPAIVDERTMKIDTPLPSEQILYPGMHTPLSWLSTTISLTRLKREIIQVVYPDRSTQSTHRTISFATISSLLLSLQKWYRLIPPHLRHDVPVAPTHKRAVAVLHLQYWSSTILLCRPFLLYLVHRHAVVDLTRKVWFERMGKTCIDAAQKSLSILQRMAEDNALTSITAFDSTCLLRIVMIFILAFGHTKMHMYRSNIEDSLMLLRGMHQVGFCKMVTQETPMRLEELGIGQYDARESAGVLLDDDLIAMLWGSLDSANFVTPLQSQQSLDLTFDDSSSFQMDDEILQFTNLDDSIMLDSSQAWPSFNLR